MHGAKSSSQLIFSRTFRVAIESTFQNPHQLTPHRFRNYTRVCVCTGLDSPGFWPDHQAQVGELRLPLGSNTASPGLLAIYIYIIFIAAKIRDSGLAWAGSGKASFAPGGRSAARSSGLHIYIYISYDREFMILLNARPFTLPFFALFGAGSIGSVPAGLCPLAAPLDPRPLPPRPLPPRPLPPRPRPPRPRPSAFGLAAFKGRLASRLIFSHIHMMTSRMWMLS